MLPFSFLDYLPILFLIPAAIAQIFNPIVKLTNSIGTPSKEAKA